MIRRSYRLKPGSLTIAFLLLLAWPAAGVAQVSSYGNTLVFKDRQSGSVTFDPVSPQTGKAIANAPAVSADISPEGELMIRNARYGTDPERFEAALQPGRYVIVDGLIPLPVYLDYDGERITLSDAPFFTNVPESLRDDGGPADSRPATGSDRGEAGDVGMPPDPTSNFDIEAYLQQLDKIVDRGDLSTVCSACRPVVEDEHRRISQYRKLRDELYDTMDKRRKGIDALSRSIDNTGDPTGRLRRERTRAQQDLRNDESQLGEFQSQIARAMLEIFRCLRRKCQLPAIPAAVLAYLPVYDDTGGIDFDRTSEDPFHHYFVSTDCAFCEAGAKEINEWIVKNAGNLVDWKARRAYTITLREKRNELVDHCTRIHCSGFRGYTEFLKDSAAPQSSEAIPSGGIRSGEPETDGADEPEDAQAPAAEKEEPKKVGARPAETDTTGLYAAREPGFDIRAGAGFAWLGDLEYNVAGSVEEAMEIFGVPESAVRSRAEDQTVGVSVEIGHSWEVHGALVRAALSYQDFSGMRGKVKVDLANGATAKSIGESEVDAIGFTVERVNFLETSAVGGATSYTIGGGILHVDRDDTAVSTISRNGVELERAVTSQSDSDTTWFFRLGANFRVSAKGSINIRLDTSGGLFESDSSLTSLNLTYSHEL